MKVFLIAKHYAFFNIKLFHVVLIKMILYQNDVKTWQSSEKQILMQNALTTLTQKTLMWKLYAYITETVIPILNEYSICINDANSYLLNNPERQVAFSVFYRTLQ